MLTKILNSTRISHKLLLISASFLMPIAVLLYFMIDGINYDIRFATLELYGNEYQRPLEELLQSVPQHQLLASRIASGDTGLENRLDASSSRIDQALQRLNTADAKFGEDLQFTTEGLGKRQRSSANPRALGEAWQTLQRDIKSLDADELESQHRKIRETVRTMISHSGDTSNLILDPDLDSYYLMDITLLALPQTQDRLADIVWEGRAMLAKEQLTEADRLRLAVLATLLQESDFDRIESSTRTALNEDQNFYGVSPTMRNVEQALDQYMTVACLVEIGP